MRALSGVLGSAAAVVLVPSLAQGATICVSVAAPACESTEPTVQAGLTAAGATAAHDRVVIGPGIFDGPFVYAAGIDAGGVDIVGQGPETILTESPNAPIDGVTVLTVGPDAAGNPANVSKLAVHIPANATAGNPGNIGIDAGGTVENVEVHGSAVDLGGNGQIGVRLAPGETVRDSEIRMPQSPPGGAFSTGVRVAGPGTSPGVIAGTSISAGVGVEALGKPARITRSTIVSRVRGIDVCTTDVVAEDSVFRPFTGTAIDVNAGRCATAPSSLTARHLTIVGPHALSATIGVQVAASNQAPTQPRSATVTHSIVRDVGTAFSTITADPGASATATTSVGTSIFEAGRVTTTTGGGGAATFTQPQANFDVDPLFTDPLAGDLTLQPTSPAIDATFSPALAADESATDRAGNARITDGNGDGVAARDIGAFERAAVPVTPDRTAPETTITKGPKKKIKTAAKRKRVTFTFESSEPGSRFECRLDDAEFAACASPFERKAKRGRHTFEVRATDAAGNVDATPAKHSFAIKKKRKK